ncbi:MAG: phosphoenolpyruvate synthase [Dehalococcoidales bacterium]|nr:phosphoenolpyruvate synthase [Dehalococcoidales bacterium]
MPEAQKAIIWFSEITRQDITTVGGKGANLGEMANAGIPVPPGFVVTAHAYFDFLRQAEISDKIRRLLQPLDTNNSKQLQQIAKQIQQVILEANIPPGLAIEIEQAYLKLGQGPVAVRSSATAEDLPEASFAGQQSTFLNIQGKEAVVTAVQECWASLFEARSIFYREEQGFDHLQVGIAVPVEKMVQSEFSGVMFTTEPVTNDDHKIIIEAIYGLGEAIVSGEENPDLYIIDKEKLRVISKKANRQSRQLIRNPNHDDKNPNIWVSIPTPKQAIQKLTDEDIIQLARLGKQIEAHYQFPQDIEWAKEGSKFFITQTRPVTTIKEGRASGTEPEIKAPVLLSGVAASPGIASGPVKIILNTNQINRVSNGDILVTEMTTPDFVPAMKRATAIVTNRGGRTAHAAIISRELGIPCVVGVEQATTTLADKQIITVDGSHGKIYDGKVTRRIKTTLIADIFKDTIQTKTRVYVNLAQPELADSIAARNVDGVGLLRAEFMIAHIGEHPKYMLDQNRGQEFVDKLAQGITTFTKAFNPRPVVYRTTDLKTNEYRKLTGGEKYEETEENPMLGYRGASRYVRDIDSFKLELEAIKQVRQDYPNLWVMIPFVRTVNELAQTVQIIESVGLKRSKNFKLWMMAEVPSNVTLLEKFLAVGIDGVSIGSNDLTQLTLGIDRDNERLADTFDERNEAVLIALERIITVSRDMGVTCSICGQAPSVYPELTEKLVKWGITSVSVSPDMIGITREIIARAEAKLKPND